MKKKSPLSIDRIQFYAYGFKEKKFINQFLFDNRHDFIIDSDFGGIAVKIELSKNDYSKGVRRNLTLTMGDMPFRCEVAVQKLKVNLHRDEFFKDYYVDFPVESDEMKPWHTYKFVVCDDNASEKLAECVFHLFDEKAFGLPTNWYEVCDGGIRPPWENILYKSLNTLDEHQYYVRFNLSQCFGPKPPTILPELELRLHYPNGTRIVSDFRKPKCKGQEDYLDNRLFVEFPFTTSSEINGIFYAELLCMKYPIAGFVYDTQRPEERGSWVCQDIKPLFNYSLDVAIDRLNKSLPDLTYSQSKPDEFEEALNVFINNPMSKSDPESTDYK